MLYILCRIFDCFFREIRPRNGYKIPKSGPIIFVAAPHANQFVDPIILQGQVKLLVNRRISFLIASKSLKRVAIGFLARCQLSIGVNRAQDNMKSASGKIIIKFDEEPTRVFGIGTKFTKECMVKGLIGLPKSLGNTDIKEIISDTELIIRKEFNRKNPKVEKLLTEGTSFKIADKIDQQEVYNQVFQHLSHGHCIGIFPEGGSHDRTSLLPLKAGVGIMALGAMAEHPGLNVKIVPCGMNYFHAHKFRSRAVVEFGDPIEVNAELVKQYQHPEKNREAVKTLLDEIQDGLKAVTVQCDSYETLMIVQASRRLYQGNFVQRLPLHLVNEFNRRIVKGYERYQDNQRIIDLKEKILKYNQLLKDHHLADHTVETAEINILRNICILIYRGFNVFLLFILALPGTFLFSPVFFTAKLISDKKQKEALAGSVVKIKARDVVATWKILISMLFAPLLYIFYSTLITFYCYRKDYFASYSLILIFVASYLVCASITYAALIVGESGMDLFKSLIPLYLSITDPIDLHNLKLQRRELAVEITEAINDFGMEMFPDDFNILEMDTKKVAKGFDKFGNKVSNDELEEQEEERKTMELRQRRKEKRKAKLQKEHDMDSENETSNVDSDAISRINSTNSLSNIPVFSEYQQQNLSASPTKSSSSISDYNGGISFEAKSALKDKIKAKMQEKQD